MLKKYEEQLVDDLSLLSDYKNNLRWVISLYNMLIENKNLGYVNCQVVHWKKCIQLNTAS